MSGGTGSAGDRDAIGRALSRLPSGLFVLTAGTGDRAVGMLTSWVQQVGFEPPTIVVALRKGRPLEALVRKEGAFCLAVLDQASKPLLRHFARAFDPDQPAFGGIDTTLSSIGVPFPSAAHAHLVCRVRGVVDDWSDHAVVCGEVVGGDGRTEVTPLVHVRKSGFSY